MIAHGKLGKTGHAVLNAAAELAGFFAAHGTWSVSEGEALIPLIGFETRDAERKMLRFASDRLEEGATQALDCG